MIIRQGGENTNRDQLVPGPIKGDEWERLLGQVQEVLMVQI